MRATTAICFYIRRKRIMESGFLHQLVQQLINGISLGSIYALIALGYTMIYGILKLINFAHGDIYMLGAYIRGSPGRYDY